MRNRSAEGDETAISFAGGSLLPFFVDGLPTEAVAPWTLHFETPDRAINAMRGLLCDPEVASASTCSAAK